MERIGLAELVLLIPFASIMGGVVIVVIATVRHKRRKDREMREMLARRQWLRKGGYSD